MRRAAPFGPRILVTAIVVAGGLAACAKVGPPPGGPEDRDPPSVAETIPPNGAAGVAPDSAVVIVFSEKLNRRSVMRALRVIPPVDFRETTWDEGRLTLRPETEWARDRNTLIRIAATAKDRRGNLLTAPFGLQFTTKAVPDSGALVGKVWLGREKSRRTRAIVLAFAGGDTVPDMDTAHPDAVAEPDGKGNYRLEGLDPALPWHVLGILDVDDDLRALTPGEARGGPPGRILMAGAEAQAEVPEFLIGTLDSLGTIGGEVTADSAASVFAWARRDTADSVSAFDARVGVPGGGAFELEVPTGFSYAVGAFVDTDVDSLPGPDEKATRAEAPIPLLFTPTRAGLTFDLATPPDSLPPLPAPIPPANPPAATAAGEEAEAAAEAESPPPDEPAGEPPSAEDAP